jgi:type IV secretion system protein VirB9
VGRDQPRGTGRAQPAPTRTLAGDTLVTPRIFVLPLALLIAQPAPAADRRVLELPWQPGVVVPITTTPGFEAAIAMSPDERVENIAIGNSALWQVTPNRRANLVFLKPASARAPVTNMTVDHRPAHLPV